MTKKVDFPNNRKSQGDGKEHNNQNITANYNYDLKLINISHYFSGEFFANILPTYNDLRLEEPELSNLSGYEDCDACYLISSMSDSSGVFSASFSPTCTDSGSGEPDLSKLRGYDDCETCYYRLSKIDCITQEVKKHQGGSYK
jgi:hypothetical protein